MVPGVHSFTPARCQKTTAIRFVLFGIPDTFMHGDNNTGFFCGNRPLFNRKETIES